MEKQRRDRRALHANIVRPLHDDYHSTSCFARCWRPSSAPEFATHLCAFNLLRGSVVDQAGTGELSTASTQAQTFGGPGSLAQQFHSMLSFRLLVDALASNSACLAIGDTQLGRDGVCKRGIVLCTIGLKTLPARITYQGVDRKFTTSCDLRAGPIPRWCFQILLGLLGRPPGPGAG